MDDYIRYNPSDHALKELKKANNHDTEKRRALTLQEQELFEVFLEKNGPYHIWWLVFTVMLWTGMRVGEMIGLRWEDIDFENEIINVNHTLVYYNKGGKRGCGYSINTPKTARGQRQIPMLPKVKKAFLYEKEFQEEIGIKCNVEIDGYTNFIFLNRFGKAHNQSTLNKALRRIIRDCNYEVIDKAKDNNDEIITLPPFSCHTLRHTFTIRMCAANVNVKAMQDILGHAGKYVTNLC